MQPPVILILITTVVAGGLLPLQFALNGLLAKTAASTAVWAAFVSVTVSTLVLGVLSALLLERWPRPAEMIQIPYWLWIGGVFGAVFVGVSTFSIPRIGAAIFFAALLFGQMGASIVLDHYGLLGVPRDPMNGQKLLGILLIFAGFLTLQFD